MQKLPRTMNMKSMKLDETHELKLSKSLREVKPTKTIIHNDCIFLSSCVLLSQIFIFLTSDWFTKVIHKYNRINWRVQV